MTLQKVAPGGMLEIPSLKEIHAPMDHLLTMLGRNARFHRAVIQQPVSDTAGNWQLQAGPQDGFMWAVMLVAVDPGLATGSWLLYVNDPKPSNLVSPTVVGPNVALYGKSQLILKSNDVLIAKSVIVGGVSYPVAMTLHCIEVPVEHEAQLLL